MLYSCVSADNINNLEQHKCHAEFISASNRIHKKLQTDKILKQVQNDNQTVMLSEAKQPKNLKVNFQKDDIPSLRGAGIGGCVCLA